MSGVLHFGAGALGRGLILPRMAQHGAALAIADTDAALVERVRADGGYRLAVLEPGARQERFVPITQAFAIGRDDTALDDAIAEATVVTTSVQVGNLSAVAGRLARVWSGKSGPPRTVVGCENMRKVGSHLAALFGPETGASLTLPDCVVDRICATAPSGLAVEAECYTEWVVETAKVPGADTAADVDRLFFRKRYLVNTLADAAAFLGVATGCRWLHEAIGNRAIVEAVAPLMAALKQHLHRAFGFALEEIDAYEALSLARLGNSAISRRLETVARHPWRKFGQGERFMEPLLAEAAAGADISAGLAVVARIMRHAEPDSAVIRARLSEDWTSDGARAQLPRMMRLVQAERP